MSRRSRRGKSTTGSRWIGRLGVGLVVSIFCALALGYLGLRNYLHSDGFRLFLSAEASQASAVDGKFTRFRWDGLAVDTDSFQGVGVGPLAKVQADGLHTEVGFGAVSRGFWEIRSASVRRLDLTVDTRVSASPYTSGIKELSSKSRPPAWIPNQVEVHEVDIQELNLHALLDGGLATLSGARVRAEMAGAQHSYRAQIDGGNLHLSNPKLPELRLGEVHLRYQEKNAFLTKASLKVWENGDVNATGEFEIDSKQFSLEGDASGISCEEILSRDWAKRLTGTVSSTFSINNSQGALHASGRLDLENGMLTAIPLLDTLAAYADTRRFRNLILNEAHTDWQWEKGKMTLSRLVLFSDGLIRIEGGLVIRDRDIDGVFRLGLAPGTLANIPGAETHVFLRGERGLLWTNVRITGTLDDPKEDLSARLIDAAGLRMFELIPDTGEKVMKFTESILGENSRKTLEKSTTLLKHGEKNIRDVSEILGGIFSGGSRKNSKTDDSAQ
jgi:hypothetical protein